MPIAFAAQPNLLLSLFALDGLKFYAGRSAYDSTWMFVAGSDWICLTSHPISTHTAAAAAAATMSCASQRLLDLFKFTTIDFLCFSLLSLRGYDGGGTRFLPPVR